MSDRSRSRSRVGTRREIRLGPRPQGIPKARGGRPEFERRVIVSESSSSSSRRASVSDSAASASSSQVQHQDPQSVTTASSSSKGRPVQQQCLVSQDLPGVRVWKVDSEYNPVEVWLEEVSRQLLICSRATWPAHSGVLEAHGHLLALKWLSKQAAKHHHKVPSLVDAKTVIVAATKGRSSARALRTVLRSSAVHCLACDLLPRLVYIPSESKQTGKTSGTSHLWQDKGTSKAGGETGWLCPRFWDYEALDEIVSPSFTDWIRSRDPGHVVACSCLTCLLYSSAGCRRGCVANFLDKGFHDLLPSWRMFFFGFVAWGFDLSMCTILLKLFMRGRLLRQLPVRNAGCLLAWW